VTVSYEEDHKFSDSIKGWESDDRVFNLSRRTLLPEVNKFSIAWPLKGKKGKAIHVTGYEGP
jgi:hypothetical protein